MSVQLILYPQGYKGVYNSFTNPSSEMIVNGISFNNLDNALAQSGNNVSLIVSASLPPTIPNAWYRFKGTGAIGVAYPYNLNGNLFIPTISGLESGVYQQLTNIVPNLSYNITIDIVTPPQPNYAGKLIVRQYSPANISNTEILTKHRVTEDTTQIVQLIQSQVPNPTLVFSYRQDDAVSDNITIRSISVTPTVATSGSILLDDGQVICDLYEDEDLPLTLSVDEFKNVAEKVQSYSKAFNLPATKRNNRIFDQVFEVTRHLDGGSPLFNPYQKTQCVLKQDGFILFEGYLRLLDITDKEGEISYNVNLYSEVIALADELKDLELRDLDFSELEHDYNKTQIQNSWNVSGTGISYLNPNTSGFRNDYSTVKYPFVNWNNQILVANGSTGTSATLNNPELTALEQAFRPFINIRYIIDRIFQVSQFTYSSDFFNENDFNQLYMDFNWGSDNAPVVFNSVGELTKLIDFNIPITYTTIVFDEMNAPLVGGNPLNSEFGYSSGVFTAQEDGQVYSVVYDMQFDWGLLGALDELSLEWVINGTPNAAVYDIPFAVGGFRFVGNFTTTPLQAGDTILLRAKSLSNKIELDGVFSIGVTPSLLKVTTSSTQTTSDTLLGTLRGEVGQWEFLKGLITMFNLVTLVDENNPNNIIIEPYSDIFINNDDSVQLNWTDKVDVSQMKLEPLTDLNRKTIFKFVEDDDDFAFNNYKNLVGGHLYGSNKFNATDEFNILDGENEIIAEPFAATVVKPLMSQYSGLIIPQLYSYNIQDGTSEGFDNSPRIMYNNGVKDSGTTYYIPAQNGVGETIAETDFLQFSHLSAIPSDSSSLDYHFGWTQLLNGVGSGTLRNLFTLYWFPYLSELYNINTRTMTIKVDLNPADLSTFKFYDKVIIKNREFRVNKIDYKPNDLATVEFILIP
tara:strand:+ start:2394 stop:5126 length:2733 start_codon:yes stop_codon:yes gene_type:complete